MYPDHPQDFWNPTTSKPSSPLKSVVYAFPTSTHAKQFGRASSGCWIVETHENIQAVGKPIAAFDTEAEANPSPPLTPRPRQTRSPRPCPPNGARSASAPKHAPTVNFVTRKAIQ